MSSMKHRAQAGVLMGGHVGGVTSSMAGSE